jgi:hypothetical protein
MDGKFVGALTINSLSSTEAGSKRFQASKRKQLKFFAA